MKNILTSFNQSKYKKYLPWIVLGLTYVFMIALNYYVQWRCLDSDCASDMVLANLLNEEGSIISKNWHYSTSIKVFCETLLFRLGLIISPNNWRIARLIGHSIHLAIYILSFIFLLYGTEIKEKGIWVAIVLLLPFGFWYLFHGVIGGTYLGPTYPIFLLLGLLLRYAKKQNIIYLLLTFIFSVIFGLNGIMILMYYTVPLIVTVVVIYLYKYIVKDKTSYKNYLLPCIFSTVGSIIGVCVYIFVFSKIYSNNPSFYLDWGQLSISNILYSISRYLQSLGFIMNDSFDLSIKVLSINGVLGVFGIANIIVFIIGLIVLLKNKYYINGKNKFLFIFIISAYFCGICMFALCSKVKNASYWIPFIPLAFIIIELLFEELKDKGFNIKCFRILMLISVICCSFANTSIYVKTHPRTPNGAQEIANVLVENNCKNVVTTFWLANDIAEYSNGTIEPYTVIEFYEYKIEKWLQKIDHTSIPQNSDTCIVIPNNPGHVDILNNYYNNYEYIDYINGFYIYRMS